MAKIIFRWSMGSQGPSKTCFFKQYYGCSEPITAFSGQTDNSSTVTLWDWYSFA